MYPARSPMPQTPRRLASPAVTTAPCHFRRWRRFRTVTVTSAPNAGATGAVTVDGTGSTWTNTGLIGIGQGGAGSLAITNGGVVSNTTAEIGYVSGSAGTVLVAGAGSALTNTGAFMDVGNAGNGDLTLVNGGKVNVNGGAGTINLGAAGGAGTLNIGTAATRHARGRRHRQRRHHHDGRGHGHAAVQYYRHFGRSLLPDQGRHVRWCSGCGDRFDFAHQHRRLQRPHRRQYLYRQHHGRQRDAESGHWFNYSPGRGRCRCNAPGDNGALVIANGGDVSNSNSSVGYAATSTGTVTVDGRGQHLDQSVEPDGGFFGTGTVNATNGGALTSLFGYIGMQSAGRWHSQYRRRVLGPTRASSTWARARPARARSTSPRGVVISDAGTYIATLPAAPARSPSAGLAAL